jgi:hypothetical protein
MPTNGIWVCLYLIYPKMYPNSLLVSLNSRGNLQGQSSAATRTPTYELSQNVHASISRRDTAVRVVS